MRKSWYDVELDWEISKAFLNRFSRPTDTLKMFISEVIGGPDNANRFYRNIDGTFDVKHLFRDYEDSYVGFYRSPRVFAEQVCADIGDYDPTMPAYIRLSIDWQIVADELSADYIYVQEYPISAISDSVHVFGNYF